MGGGVLADELLCPVLSYCYDVADRHLSTLVAGVRQVTLARDALDRIVARTDTDLATNTTSTTRYGFAGAGDAVSALYDTANNLIETTVALPAGVLYTKRVGTSTDVWSYPNIHGDVAATRVNGTVTAFNWDPYGNPVGAVPDNSAGTVDWGWLGQHQRTLDHPSGLNPVIEMGTRVYQPDTGRFQQTDPIEDGTTTNPYGYVPDPINQYDLDGQCGRWGNPWKKCGKGHRGEKGFLGGTFSKSWRLLLSASNHLEANIGGCAYRCFSLGLQGGTLYRQSGYGCCFVGATASVAFRNYSDRACSSVVISGNAGVSVSVTQGLEGPLASSATDVEIGTGIGAGYGAGYLRNHDLLGGRFCP